MAQNANAQAALLKTYDTISQVKYNNQIWLQKIIIYHGTDKKDLLFISNTNVKKIIISNDLQLFCNYIEIIIRDQQFRISDHVKINESLINIEMIQNYKVQSQEEQQQIKPIIMKQHSFVINNLSVLSYDDTYIEYKIIGSSDNLINLLKNIKYTTNKGLNPNNPASPIEQDTPESPLQIIKNVTNLAGQTFDPVFKDTDRRIHFINFQNMTAKAIIEYCLATAVSPKTPPYFYVYSLLDRKSRIVNMFSQNSEFINKDNLNLEWVFNKLNNTENESAKSQRISTKSGSNISILPLSDTTNIKNKILKLTTVQENGGLLSNFDIKAKQFFTFDHNTRKWTSQIYKSQDIKKLLSELTLETTIMNKPVSIFFDSFLKANQNNSEQKQIYHNYMYGQEYTYFRNLIFNQSVSLQILGKLSRDAGQFLTINVVNNDIVQTLYGNMWQIYKCSHIWENTQYLNYIIAFRTMRPLIDVKRQSRPSSLSKQFSLA